MTHGGRCVHERQWSRCIECNPNAKNQMKLCSSCVDKRIARKRQREAAEAGAEPPPASKRWEGYVLRVCSVHSLSNSTVLHSRLHRAPVFSGAATSAAHMPYCCCSARA